MNPNITQKLEKLRKILKSTCGCGVAYSGGVDSSLVLQVAHEVLGDRCIAIIATSSTYTRKEFEAALRWVRSQDIPYRIIHSEELEIPGFNQNPPDRCYYCKKELFTKARQVASSFGFEFVADGSNADDLLDFRPGMIACEELGVISPLREAGLAKEEIRLISREIYHLPMANKPAMACLASRFPYGSPITAEKLKQVEAVEDMLAGYGLKTVRARHHGEIVRIEVEQESMELILKQDVREAVVQFAREQGFTYITLDLGGYRTGSMNEVLQ